MSPTSLEAAAWADLEPLRREVMRALRRDCRDENQLDDVVQETFLRAARFRRGLADRARLRAWVVRIARNVLSDHVRRERTYRGVDGADEILALAESRELTPGEAPTRHLVVAEQPLPQDELTGLLAEVLPRLSAQERGLLERYYGEGRCCSEAGDALGLSAERVKMRLYRLRGCLRRELERRARLRRAERGHPLEASA
ncbi:MAG: sigma-70 family RNA polymerase sigma factor [Planctomycetes bacterium]|nr:sigma-70 family RNA polymerase sigma factor [Planctomycetota bacterium]